MNLLMKMNQFELVEFCESELESEIEISSPELRSFLENIGEFSCSEEEILYAIRIAPGAVMRQMLFAVYRHRQHATMATGI